MTPTTKRLTGNAIRGFLARRLRVDGNLPLSDSEKIATALAPGLVSLVVRTDAAGRLWSRWRRLRPLQATEPTCPEAAVSPPVGSSETVAASVPEPAPPTTGTAAPIPLTTAEPDAHPEQEKPFDPYAFGLVPTYQREGREGLAEKLATVATVDQLRLLARSQQIALPAEIRRGDVAAEDVRAAIVNAVEKRIADRRAAAS